MELGWQVVPRLKFLDPDQELSFLIWHAQERRVSDFLANFLEVFVVVGACASILVLPSASRSLASECATLACSFVQGLNCLGPCSRTVREAECKQSAAICPTSYFLLPFVVLVKSVILFFFVFAPQLYCSSRQRIICWSRITLMALALLHALSSVAQYPPVDLAAGLSERSLCAYGRTWASFSSQVFLDKQAGVAILEWLSVALLSLRHCFHNSCSLSFIVADLWRGCLLVVILPTTLMYILEKHERARFQTVTKKFKPLKSVIDDGPNEGFLSSSNKDNKGVWVHTRVAFFNAVRFLSHLWCQTSSPRLSVSSGEREFKPRVFEPDERDLVPDHSLSLVGCDFSRSWTRTLSYRSKLLHVSCGIKMDEPPGVPYTTAASALEKLFIVVVGDNAICTQLVAWPVLLKSVVVVRGCVQLLASVVVAGAEGEEEQVAQQIQQELTQQLKNSAHGGSANISVRVGAGQQPEHGFNGLAPKTTGQDVALDRLPHHDQDTPAFAQQPFTHSAEVDENVPAVFLSPSSVPCCEASGVNSDTMKDIVVWLGPSTLSPEYGFRVVVATHECRVILDSGVVEAEAHGERGGCVRLRLPVGELTATGLSYVHILHERRSSGELGERASRASGNARLLASIPLFVAPSSVVCEELQGLWEAIVGDVAAEMCSTPSDSQFSRSLSSDELPVNGYSGFAARACHRHMSPFLQDLSLVGVSAGHSSVRSSPSPPQAAVLQDLLSSGLPLLHYLVGNEMWATADLVVRRLQEAGLKLQLWGRELELSASTAEFLQLAGGNGTLEGLAAVLPPAVVDGSAGERSKAKQSAAVMPAKNVEVEPAGKPHSSASTSMEAQVGPQNYQFLTVQILQYAFWGFPEASLEDQYVLVKNTSAVPLDSVSSLFAVLLLALEISMYAYLQMCTTPFSLHQALGWGLVACNLTVLGLTRFATVWYIAQREIILISLAACQWCLFRLLQPNGLDLEFDLRSLQFKLLLDNTLEILGVLRQVRFKQFLLWKGVDIAIEVAHVSQLASWGWGYARCVVIVCSGLTCLFLELRGRAMFVATKRC